MGDRECGHDLEELQERSTEEEQADDEKNVVGPNEDVMDAFAQELPNDCKSALTPAGGVIDLHSVFVENALIFQLLTLIDVAKGLVARISREQPAVYLKRSSRFLSRKLELQPEIPSPREWFESLHRGSEVFAVGADC